MISTVNVELYFFFLFEFLELYTKSLSLNFVFFRVLFVYIIKRTLHGGLKIWTLFSRGKHNTALVPKILCCHSKIKFILSRHRVISSIYYSFPFIYAVGFGLIWKTMRRLLAIDTQNYLWNRLQNSPYFRVFKYAQTVKQKVWNEAENDFFTDFEKKTDCFAVCLWKRAFCCMSQPTMTMKTTIMTLTN